MSKERQTGIAIAIDTIEAKQEIDDERHRRFPGWFTYGIHPDYSGPCLALRNILYPGWHTTTQHLERHPDLQPFYIVKCKSLEEANWAIFVQPKNVRAEIQITGIETLSYNDLIHLIKPPFVRVEVVHQHD